VSPGDGAAALSGVVIACAAIEQMRRVIRSV
jgi:hypothetical protein